MKAHYKSSTGRLVIEVEGPNAKAIFERIAEVQEILDADAQCGCCGSPQIKFRVRDVKGNRFFELHCEACHARLAFGQNRDGVGLFPRRFDDSRKPLPNRGWAKFLPAPEGSASQPAPAAPPPQRGRR